IITKETDYTGAYEISNFGRAKSLDREIKTKNGKTFMSLGKVLKQGKRNGYPNVQLCKNGKIKCCSIHRLVALNFVENPNPQEFTQVNHIDFDRCNNKENNLEWVSPRMNLMHKIDNNRANVCKGEKHYFSKLTKEQVIEIKVRIRNGEKRTAIAKDYPVDESQIYSISDGKTWAWVEI
ncbi:MAG TPA: NUMOD4 domain-containing protein, partial [Bacteroidales bacterium]|nr:NUMOD4 domain-containing protein [Bacteroidales bacterium]